MAGVWKDADVHIFLKIWGKESIQEQLEGSKRNQHIYERIAKEMKKIDSVKTADQCRAKMKKLKLDYKKVKSKHGQTRESRINWKFLEAMDAVLGHRPITRPSILLDTSEQLMMQNR